jgi:hypothetical protein
MSKVDIRIPQIARMRVAGLKDAVIAATVGLSPPGLARILALPEYKEVEDSILQGTISKMDLALAGRADLCRQEFKVGVPMAMRTLLDTVQQRRDLRASLKAAEEILDRDPDRTFVKVSKVEPAVQTPTLTGEVLQALAPQADKVTSSLKGVAPSAENPAPAASEKVQ